MFTISQIAENINGKIDGNPDLPIQGVCDLKNSRADHLSYIVSDKYEKYFHQSKANSMLVTNDFAIDRGDKTLIHVENPAVSIIDVIHLFYLRNPVLSISIPVPLFQIQPKLGKTFTLPHM